MLVLPSLADVSSSPEQDSPYLYYGIFSNSSEDGTILLTPHYLRRKEEIFYGKKRLMSCSRWWCFFCLFNFPTLPSWFPWFSVFFDRKGTQDSWALLPKQPYTATLPFTASPALPSTRFSAEKCFFSPALPWCLILPVLPSRAPQFFMSLKPL